MMYAVSREFSVTALTEALGLIWALAAIPFLLEGIKNHSVAHAALGVSLLTVALFTRMGSMFTIPALAAWAIWNFGIGYKEKLRVAGLTAVALGTVFALNATASKMYSTDTALIGSNFSYVLCGLSIGGNWSDCMTRYGSEAPNSEVERTSFFYRKASENIVAQPRILLHRMVSAAASFARDLPSALIKGYRPVPPLSGWTLAFAAIVSLIGLTKIARFVPWDEIIFWIVFWLSVFASASLVFFDDGRRIMIVVIPLVAVFVVSGFRVTSRPYLGAVKASTGAVAALAFLLVILTTPWIIRNASPQGVGLDGAKTPFQYVFGGSRITGVLVVNDGEPLRQDVPTIHLSDFAKIVRDSGIEDVQGLVTPQPPATPFGFVASPNLLVGRPTRHLFIVPAKVLLEKNVPAWRFRAAEILVNPGHEVHWFSVTEAVAVGPDNPP